MSVEKPTRYSAGPVAWEMQVIPDQVSISVDKTFYSARDYEALRDKVEGESLAYKRGFEEAAREYDAKLDAKDALIRAGEEVFRARKWYDDDYAKAGGLTENSESFWTIYEDALADYAYQKLKESPAMTTPKLEPGTPLPCPNPWCRQGSPALKNWRLAEPFDKWSYQCDFCSVEGPVCATPELALAAWNTRHPDPRQQEKIEALEDERADLRTALMEKNIRIEALVKLFHIWAEGYAATGGAAGAYFHGTQEGFTFKDACIKHFAKVDVKGAYFDSEQLSYWGCRLFDNADAARKSFG